MKDDDIKASWEDAIKDLRKEFERRFDEARAKSVESMESGKKAFEDSMENGRKVVQEHPFLALGVTLTLGILLGALLGRKSRD